MSVSSWLRSQSRLTLAAVGIGLAAALTLSGVGLEALVRGRLNQSGTRAPTRLYARPLVLRPEASADKQRVERYLRRLGYHEARGHAVAIGEYRLDPWAWTIGTRPFRLAGGMAPGGLTQVTLDWGDRVSAIHDAAARPLPALVLEPRVIHSVHRADLADRVPVKLEEVPQHLVDAVLTVEDRSFFQHGGVSLRRIAGAAWANAKAGRVTQGGSTITQQLARTLWLSSRRTPWRKLREMAMSLTLELRYSKPEILEAYLNEVYLGQDGALAIRGVGRAAQFYFGKDVTELGPAQSALIAGLIRGPNLYAPFRDSEATKARRDFVLGLMRARQVLPENTYRAAKREPLALRRTPETHRTSRYFSDWVLQELATRQGSERTARGLAVFTTLDLELQRLAEDAVTQGVRRLERAHPGLARTDQPLQAALVALDPWTGEVLAMVGGRDYGASQFNRAIRARRQPGSAFKPIVALAALSPQSDVAHPDAFPLTPPFTLASELDDEPLEIETAQGVWRPVNYDGSFGGRVTLRAALERSLNVPFARLGLAVGPERIAETARALGIDSRLQPVPSLALGASEVTLLELTRAFSTFAAYGYRANTITTLAVLDASGEPLQRADPGGERVVAPAVAYLITSALQGVAERGTARALRSWGVNRPVAAKTGTTNDHRDAWLVGYTPRLAVGVWVGFDDGRSLGISGAGAALPIFASFLRDPARDDRDDAFPVPPGIEFADAGPGCEREVFLAGSAPEPRCAPYWFSWRPVRDGLRSLAQGLRRLLGGR